MWQPRKELQMKKKKMKTKFNLKCVQVASVASQNAKYFHSPIANSFGGGI